VWNSHQVIVKNDHIPKAPDLYHAFTVFHKFSRFDESLIAKFFSREVFSMLLHEGLINLELVQKILRWRHTGFHVHSKVRITSLMPIVAKKERKSKTLLILP